MPIILKAIPKFQLLLPPPLWGLIHCPGRFHTTLFHTTLAGIHTQQHYSHTAARDKLYVNKTPSLPITTRPSYHFGITQTKSFYPRLSEAQSCFNSASKDHHMHIGWWQPAPFINLLAHTHNYNRRRRPVWSTRVYAKKLTLKKKSSRYLGLFVAVLCVRKGLV